MGDVIKLDLAAEPIRSPPSQLVDPALGQNMGPLFDQAEAGDIALDITTSNLGPGSLYPATETRYAVNMSVAW